MTLRGIQGSASPGGSAAPGRGPDAGGASRDAIEGLLWTESGGRDVGGAAQRCRLVAIWIRRGTGGAGTTVRVLVPGEVRVPGRGGIGLRNHPHSAAPRIATKISHAGQRAPPAPRLRDSFGNR